MPQQRPSRLLILRRSLTFARLRTALADCHAKLLEQGIAATRQLAKRQLTWLRSTENLTEFDCLTENVGDLVLEYIRQEIEAMVIDAES